MKKEMDKQIHITATVYRARKNIDWLQCAPKLGKFDLTKAATAEMVDTFLGAIISYNHIENTTKQQMLEELIARMKENKCILDGGIHFQSGDTHIYNGCCSGVEMWEKIITGLQKYESPWMGHDPNVSCKERNGVTYISDYPLPDTEEIHMLASKKMTVIAYENELFQKLLSNVEVEYQEFVQGPMKKRVVELMGEQNAEEFLDAFDICFGKNRYII